MQPEVMDKIQRDIENGIDPESVMSPMDPPALYDLPTQEEFKYEDYPKSIQKLLDEHKHFLEVLGNFEIALMGFKENGYKFTPEISQYFKDFFKFMDVDTPQHNRSEEKALFPVLRAKLIEVGECSPGLNQTTPTDIMEDDHIQVLQSSYLVFNLFGLGAKMKDAESQAILFQNATEQGREIVEVMKLHIYKENNVLFPLAKKHLSEADWIEIDQKMGFATSEFQV